MCDLWDLNHCPVIKHVQHCTFCLQMKVCRAVSVFTDESPFHLALRQKVDHLHFLFCSASESQMQR